LISSGSCNLSYTLLSQFCTLAETIIEALRLKQKRQQIQYFILLIMLLFGSGKNTHCQIFLDEDFSSQQMPPTGWSLEVAAAQWSESETNNAGGTIPEAMFTWVQLVDTSRLISPYINLGLADEAILQFRHMYDLYQNPGPAVGVAIKSDGSPWSSIWEISPSGNVGPEKINLDISEAIMNDQEFRICFYIKGDFWNINYWYLDDILIYQPIKLDLTLFLEGPFETESMNTDLNTSGLIPLHQPYYQFPWKYYGTETVSSLPDDDVVDWVLVELIRIDNWNPVTFSSLASQAAFVKSNGKITGLNGLALLSFSPLEEDSLKIMVHHRNHLAAISSDFVQAVNGNINYDFSAGADKSYQGQFSTKQVGPDTWATLMGEGNQDGQIDNRDKNEVWYQQKGLNGYYLADYNMDGFVDSIDIEETWTSNAGLGNRKTDSIATPFVCGDQFTDPRNNIVYETVQIGSQCWMAENLNYETGNSWCYYNSQASCDTLGRLYNWNAMMAGYSSSNLVPSGVKGICPDGWHLPSDAEWCLFTEYIDPSTDCDITGYNGTDIGVKMKSTTGWSSGGNGTNESGFNAQAGGSMGIYHFDDLHLYSYTWSCTKDYPGYSWFRKLSYGLPTVGRFFIAQSRGCSVRCLKD